MATRSALGVSHVLAPLSQEGGSSAVLIVRDRERRASGRGLQIRWQACDLRGWGGQGRGRTADLPIFSRTLVPTELPGRDPLATGTAVGDRCGGATPTGLEPATSAVTGRRANQLRHRALLVTPR